MSSLILDTAARFLLPLMLVFSLSLLNRGHDLPGGGFVGGLVVAAAMVLYGFAFGPAAARGLLRADTRRYIGGGLLLALSCGVPGMAHSGPYATGVWHSVSLPGLGSLRLATPMLFDAGVYLVVLGATLTILLDLTEE